MPPTDEDIAWFKSTFHSIPRPTLPEDCIEYSVYVISSDLDTTNDSEARIKLRDIQKYAGELQKQWLKDYIWQRQGFSLELTKEDGEVGSRISFLRGRTEYGDSIEDEWVVVWLLRELTRRFENAWVKLSDNDGEFLLIEASGTIPEWLEPEVAENRVWINGGKLRILKPKGATRSSKRTNEKLTMQDARQIVLKETSRIMHSTSIEEEAFYRLRNYPQQIKDNMHHALVTLPRKVTFLLRRKPSYISSAIEAFYLRDPIALKPIQKQDTDGLTFPPDDFVTVTIRFPKIGYAQIKSQEFPAPPVWEKRLPSRLDKSAWGRAEVGMKITCGFEILLSDSQHQDKQVVREMKMLLEDLESGEDSLPSDSELEKIEKREDDEKWLDVNMDDLEHELGGNEKGTTETGRKREFGDKAAQENLQRIVKQFENFLNDDKDGPDVDGMFGEDTDDDSDDDDLEDEDDMEDKDASFDEEEFTRIMQEMMGMPSEVMKELMTGSIDAIRNKDTEVPTEVRERAMARVEEIETSDEEEEYDNEKDSMNLKQMEAELKASGALNLHPGPSSSRHLDQKANNDVEDDTDHSEDDAGANDFDADFARNMLASFRSSGGMGGPAGNLLSMMNEQTMSGNGKGKGREKDQSGKMKRNRSSKAKKQI